MEAMNDMCKAAGEDLQQLCHVSLHPQCKENIIVKVGGKVTAPHIIDNVEGALSIHEVVAVTAGLPIVV